MCVVEENKRMSTSTPSDSERIEEPGEISVTNVAPPSTGSYHRRHKYTYYDDTGVGEDYEVFATTIVTNFHAFSTWVASLRMKMTLSPGWEGFLLILLVFCTFHRKEHYFETRSGPRW